MSIAGVSHFTYAFVRTIRVGTVCIHIAVTDVIFTFIHIWNVEREALAKLEQLERDIHARADPNQILRSSYQ